MLPLLILFIFTLLTALVTIMSVKPLQSIVKSVAIAIAIAALFVVLLYLGSDMGFTFMALFMIFVGLVIVTLVSIYKALKLIGCLMLKHGTVKSSYKEIIIYSMVAIIGSFITIPSLYLFLPHSHHRPEDASTKANMHTLQLCVYDIAVNPNITGKLKYNYRSHQGFGVKEIYPSHLNTTVFEMLKEVNQTSNNSVSLVGFNKSDTIYSKDIGSTGPSLLPAKGNFKNPYGNSKPVLIFSKTDPPVWDKKCIGVIYYVPINVEGNIALGYKIYGAGKKGLLNCLQSGD